MQVLYGKPEDFDVGTKKQEQEEHLGFGLLILYQVGFK